VVHLVAASVLGLLVIRRRQASKLGAGSPMIAEGLAPARILDLVYQLRLDRQSRPRLRQRSGSTITP
jgi:hypothetical protein